jgi:hypothetical protein
MVSMKSESKKSITSLSPWSRETYRWAISHLFAILISSLVVSLSFANEARPVAIRYWPNNGVSVETMWNLHVGIGIDASNRSDLPRAADVEFIDDFWEATPGNILFLDRKPNEPKPTLNAWDAGEQLSDDAVTIARIEIVGAENSKHLFVTSIQVNGVCIVDCKKNSVQELVAAFKGHELPSELQNVDVLLLEDASKESTEMTALAEWLKPRIVLLRKNVQLENVASSAIEIVQHNTFAVSKSSEPKSPTRWVKLGESAWSMNEPLTGLFDKKEAACLSSRVVFRELSALQMNFQPSNGTHTPRWNAEHMMGRELLFFSQIYHAVDSSVPIMDLNPKQMPAEYQAAHSDWTGREEALQMERVEAFTRRFAYLLEGMNIEQKAKGSSFWTPKSLLVQMDRHYTEHTANVVKKQSLADWPSR